MVFNYRAPDHPYSAGFAVGAGQGCGLGVRGQRRQVCRSQPPYTHRLGYYFDGQAARINCRPPKSFPPAAPRRGKLQIAVNGKRETRNTRKTRKRRSSILTRSRNCLSYL